MSLGTKIKNLRKEHRLSQGELAEKVETDCRQISRYEHDHITPSVDMVAKIAQAFDVSVDYLLFDDVARKPLRIGNNALLDKIQEIQILSEEDQTCIFHVIEALLAKRKVKNLASQIG